MLRCETCLVALEVADREDNNCPNCKDYNGYTNNKIKLPSETWIQLYGELSEYVLEYSSLEPIFEEDENGDERMTEIKQDEFCDVVGCVEEILSLHFIKEDS